MENNGITVASENKKGKFIVAGILAATAAVGVAAVLLHHFMRKEDF